MKPSIFVKLFIALFVTTILSVVGMGVAINWSFRQGFADYLHQVELERVVGLVDYLGTRYAEQESWAFINALSRRHQRRLWRQWLEQHFDLPPRRRPPPSEMFHPFSPNAPPSPDAQRPPPPPVTFELLRRLRLLDAEQQHLLGRPFAPPNETLLPIVVAEQTVGWIAVAPNPMITDRLAVQFLQQQVQTYAAIAVLVIGLSVLVSGWLTRQLLVPLQRLTCGARELAAGHYDTRLTVTRRDELGQLAQDFNRLAQTLAQNEQARRQWIADISHELRTPLAILQGEIEALQDGIRSPTPDAINSLHTEVLALGKLVDDLYELSLSDLGALAYRKTPVDIVAGLATTVGVFAARFAAKNLALRNHSTSHPPVQVFADAQRLQQLFTNLLENSLRYSDAGGGLDIQLTVQDDSVVVDFQDTPPTVATEALPQLFQRLYRVDKSRSRQFGGAGLGLAICQNIVTAHEGMICAKTAPQGGLWIQIHLPWQQGHIG